VINGAVTPGDIPDAVAFRFFYLAAEAPAGATAAARDRQRAQLHPIGLAPPDAAILRAALAEFHATLAAARSGAGSASAGPPAGAASAITLGLARTMSSAGMQRFLAFVRGQKRFMKIYSGAAAPSGPGGPL
jgi:hypothetical protein